MMQTRKPNQAPTLSGLLILFLVLYAAPTLTSAFDYDIWFKYPHPQAQTDPVNYCPESVASTSRQCQSSLPIYVNTLDSPKTLIPYTVTQLLDFCNLSEAREFEHTPHTEVDDNIFLTSFDIKFLRNEECKMLCKKVYKMNSNADLHRLEELKFGLTRDYYHHWFTDTLPFSWCYRQSPSQFDQSGLNSNTHGKECFIGFPIGYSTDERGLPEDERIPIGNFTKANAMFLFNHFEFTIFYELGEGKSWASKSGTQSGRITALRMTPRSINHEMAAIVTPATNGQQAPASSKCSYSMPPLEVPAPHHYGLNTTLQISFSYSVKFIEDEPDATWSQRWQRLESTLPNSYKAEWEFMLVIVVLLATAASAAYSLARTIFSNHVLIFVNPRDEADEATWKVLAGDIFREPLYIGLFSVLVGSGCEFIVSITISESITLLASFLSSTVMVISVVMLVVVHGFIGGYAGIRLYRTFGGEQWRLICMFINLFNPLVIIGGMTLSRNLLLVYNGSSVGIQIGLFGSIFGFAVLFAISLPSTLAGGNIAFKMSAIEFPVRPAANQRQLPEQMIWKEPLLIALVAGLIPLFCYWVVQSYPFYNGGGYVISVMTMLIIICLSISHCYFHLTQYDYRWWWRSYLVCGIGSGYIFLYCIYYICTNLFVDSFSNAVLYLLSAFFLCLAAFLITGTLGFVATFAFLWRTYSRTNASPDMNYAMFQKSGSLE